MIPSGIGQKEADCSEVGDGKRDRRKRADAIVAPCALRPHLPLLPDLGNAQGQRAPLLALRTARPSLLRLEGRKQARRRDPHLRGAVIRLRPRYATGRRTLAGEARKHIRDAQPGRAAHARRGHAEGVARRAPGRRHHGLPHVIGRMRQDPRPLERARRRFRLPDIDPAARWRARHGPPRAAVSRAKHPAGV